MDDKTLNAYSERAPEYSQDWLAQPEPIDMYQLLNQFFIENGKTADIGCGNGRDANWLALNGFETTGYDSSQKLLDLAAPLFPKVKFKQAFLPSLPEIQDQFENVLCETVIMHLPASEISEAIQNLKRLLVKNGILFLSWRVTEGVDSRHKDGRLYSAFEPDFIIEQFPKKSILHFEDKISASSGKRICRLIFRND
jgi:2-polyprenyl-3-methyl-5-hydroxy-6-metoxy-1,4-benzoquinol methylase